MTYRSARTIARHQQSPPRWRGEAEPLVLDQPERPPVVPDNVSCCAISSGTRGTREALVVSNSSHRLPKAESEHSLATPE